MVGGSRDMFCNGAQNGLAVVEHVGWRLADPSLHITQGDVNKILPANRRVPRYRSHRWRIPVVLAFFFHPPSLPSLPHSRHVLRAQRRSAAQPQGT